MRFFYPGVEHLTDPPSQIELSFVPSTHQSCLGVIIKITSHYNASDTLVVLTFWFNRTAKSVHVTYNYWHCWDRCSSTPVGQPIDLLAMGTTYCSAYVRLHCLVNELPCWATGW